MTKYTTSSRWGTGIQQDNMARVRTLAKYQPVSTISDTRQLDKWGYKWWIARHSSRQTHRRTDRHAPRWETLLLHRAVTRPVDGGVRQALSRPYKNINHCSLCDQWTAPSPVRTECVEPPKHKNTVSFFVSVHTYRTAAARARDFINLLCSTDRHFQTAF